MRSPQPHDGRVPALARWLLAVDAAELRPAIQRALTLSTEIAGAERGLVLVQNSSGFDTFASCNFPEDLLRSLTHDSTATNGRATRFARMIERLGCSEIVCHPAVAADEHEDPDASPHAAVEADLRELGVRSFLSIPLASQRKVVGVQIFACTRQERPWSHEEIDELGLIAEAIAVAIERTRSEDALRESESRFRALTEHATELIAEIDGDGRYLYVSPSSQSLLGYEPDELLGTNSAKLVHPDDLRHAAGRFVHAVELETESHASYRIRHKDGSWLWFENRGRVFRSPNGDLRFVSVARDITSKRKIEAAFVRRLTFEEHLAAISRRFLDIDSEQDLGDAIRSAIAETGELVGANRGTFISYPPESRPQTPRAYEWQTKTSSEHLRVWLPWATPRVLAGETIHLPSLDALPADASVERKLYAEQGVRSMIGVPVRASNRLEGFFSLVRTHEERAFSEEEITALSVIGQIFVSALRRRHAEEDLEFSHIQLAQAQKIEAVGRLAGGIAHDFNNLLTVILGFARPLLEESDEATQGDMEQICNAAERAATLTQQLLAFSRQQAIAARPVDLDRIVGGLEGMLRRVLEEDVELAFESGEETLVVEGDPNQLEQVVMNLALNARDALPGGGRLALRTTSVQLEGKRRHALGLHEDGRYALLEVVDDGCGMSKDIQAHLFEPFFTTKEQGKGTGLGLSIAYGVVKQAGGAIAVDSLPDKGSTFSVYLPCVASSEPTSPKVPPGVALRGSETILLAEDEPAVRTLQRRLLERAGFVVLEAADGATALAHVEGGAVIDALVTDVVMPKMGGFELAAKLREKNPQLPVLYVSGYPDEQRGAPGDQPPDGSYMRKPFRGEQLLAKIRALLDDHQD